MEKLLKISIIISIIGLFILLLLTWLPKKTTSISEITDEDIGKIIKVHGNVISERNYSDFRILTIQDDSGKIQAILNSNQQWKNMNVEVTGRIELYQSSLQINADRIISS